MNSSISEPIQNEPRVVKAAVLDVLEDSGRFLDSATSEKRVESKESKPRI